MNGPQSIPLLRFCVGSMHFAIAAEDVVAVAQARDSAVHIGAILGLEPDTRDRRVIHLASRAAARLSTEASLYDAPPRGSSFGPPLVAFQADLPVDVIRCSSDDLLPVPAAIPPDHWKPVIGFARMSERLILLLDIPSVVAKLMQNRRGGPL